MDCKFIRNQRLYTLHFSQISVPLCLSVSVVNPNHDS